MEIKITTSGPIKSVEKGSIFTQPNNPVIAFQVGDVKAVVKGDQARTLWDNFLKDGGTQATTRTAAAGTIEKEVNVSFTGTLKTFKDGVISVRDLEDIEFTYVYKLVA